MSAVKTIARAWFGPLGFGAIAATAYAVALAVAGSLAALPRGGAVAAGLTVDLVVAVPIAFWLFVARPRGWPAVSAAPVAVAGFVTASLLLPAEHRGALRAVELLLVPLELGVLGWIAYRASRGVGAARRARGADPLERLHVAAREIVPRPRVAAVLATELAVFRYTLGALRARPHVPPGAAAFACHERSAHGALVLGVAVLLAAEGLAVHVLVARWSPPIAWILTVATAWTLIWLVADLRAAMLRPILAEADAVTFRAGLRATVRVPRASIASIVRERPPGRDAVSLAFLSTPGCWVTFRSPQRLEGPYGFVREVTAIGIEPDDPEGLIRALTPPRTD